jgi:hypothetical protein
VPRAREKQEYSFTILLFSPHSRHLHTQYLFVLPTSGLLLCSIFINNPLLFAPTSSSYSVIPFLPTSESPPRADSLFFFTRWRSDRLAALKHLNKPGLSFAPLTLLLLVTLVVLCCGLFVFSCSLLVIYLMVISLCLFLLFLVTLRLLVVDSLVFLLFKTAQSPTAPLPFPPCTKLDPQKVLNASGNNISLEIKPLHFYHP